MSLASGRAARQVAPNSKQQALAKLAQLKQSGIKRTDQFAVCFAGSSPHQPILSEVYMQN